MPSIIFFREAKATSPFPFLSLPLPSSHVNVAFPHATWHTSSKSKVGCKFPQHTMFYRMQHNIVSIIPADHLVPVVQQKMRSCRNVSSSSRSIQCLQVLLLSNNCMHVEHSTFISDPFSFTSVLQNRASVFITDSDSRDHRPQCVILGLSRDALYWKMKMNKITLAAHTISQNNSSLRFRVESCPPL